MLQEQKGLLGSGTQLAPFGAGKKEGSMLLMFVAPAIVAVAIIVVSTLATTAFALVFIGWLLGLEGFLRCVKDPAETLRSEEATAARVIS
jgi:hypothetical protein